MTRSAKTLFAPLCTLSLVTLAACYGAAPGRPPSVPLPPLSDDAEIAVRSESTTKVEDVAKESWTCPAGHVEPDPACSRTTYSEAQPVTRTHTTATYGPSPITYAQFRVLTDPQWDAKLARLDELSARCKRANIPRLVGIGLALGGVIGAGIGQGVKSSSLVALSWSAAAAGGAFALGYFAFGGRACNEANALYHDMDFSFALHMDSVEGTDTAQEMHDLAERFNTGRRQHADAHLRLGE
jgi:hypothetical protein